MTPRQSFPAGGPRSQSQSQQWRRRESNPRIVSGGDGAFVPVPLRDRTGATIAYAVLDVADAHLAEHRWYLDSDPRRTWDKLYARRLGVAGAPAVYLHREVMGLLPGDPRVVDHINGLGLDNRRANLRVVTRGENSQNHRRRRVECSSSHRGVTWDKSRGKWMARAGGRTLGRFDSEAEAAAAAARWRAEHMPFSADALGRGC